MSLHRVRGVRHTVLIVGEAYARAHGKNQVQLSLVCRARVVVQLVDDVPRVHPILPANRRSSVASLYPLL